MLSKEDLIKEIKLDERSRARNEKKSSKRKIVVNKKKQLKESVELDVGAENIKIEVETILIDDNFASVTAKGTAEFLDGAPYQNEYHYFLRFEEERIIEAREYMDTQKSAEMVKHANKIQE